MDFFWIKIFRDRMILKLVLKMKVLNFQLTPAKYLAILPSMKTKLSGTTLKLYEDRVTIIKAMAHPTRLFILDQLKTGSLCVCEINEMIEADISTISKHLSVLKNAGLVSSMKKGLQVHYSLEMPCVLESFNCIEKKR